MQQREVSDSGNALVTDPSLEPKLHLDAPALHGGQQGHVGMNPAPQTGKWLGVGVVLLAAALGTGFYLVNRHHNEQEASLQKQTQVDVSAPPPVDVVPAEYAPATHMLQLPGECRAWYDSTIYARVNGYVKKWYTDIGDKVTQGQTLATIETPELDQQLAAAQAKVNADQAQINLAEAAMHFSETTLARYKDAPKGVVSDLERDERAADYQTSQAKLTAAESDLGSAQAQVDQIKAMIAFQKVTAPFDGTIAERRVDIGDLVTAGSTASTTSLFRIVQTDKIRVFVDVPESAAPEVQDGDKAVALVDEYPGKQFIGRVTRNAGALNNSTKTLRVEVDIPNSQGMLLPGMYVKVNFEMSDAHPNLEVPASAVTFRPEGPEVAVVGQDGHVVFKKVSIARDLGDKIELASGIEPGEQVALNISDEITSGDVVKANLVQEQAPATPPVASHALTSAVPVSMH